MSVAVRYWESERPEEIRTERAQLAYYKAAGKLQVTTLYRDRETGEVRRGKTAVLDRKDVVAHPEALALLERFLKEAHG
ncbi:MAG: hypothetical protein IMW98_03495 [Firmicutes bacterium]|nr:hypothetical protein [Bacillota bacterium]